MDLMILRKKIDGFRQSNVQRLISRSGNTLRMI